MLSVAVTPVTCVEHWGTLKSLAELSKKDPESRKPTMVVRPYQERL